MANKTTEKTNEVKSKEPVPISLSTSFSSKITVSKLISWDEDNKCFIIATLQEDKIVKTKKIKIEKDKNKTLNKIITEIDKRGFNRHKVYKKEFELLYV